MGQLSMTVEERERFLADLHVGVIAIEDPGSVPLVVPIWYDYEPGGNVVVLTRASSVKGRLLDASQRFSLCAQQESPPYRYVTVEGPVVSTRLADVEEDVRPMAVRYLGERGGAAYAESVKNVPDDTRIEMRPERWLTQDYSKLEGW